MCNLPGRSVVSSESVLLPFNSRVEQLMYAAGEQVAAYRNYGSGKTMILEHSRWVSDPEELLDFLQARGPAPNPICARRSSLGACRRRRGCVLLLQACVLVQQCARGLGS